MNDKVIRILMVEDEPVEGGAISRPGGPDQVVEVLLGSHELHGG